MERIREVKVTVYVDTNKATYERDFYNLEDAADYLRLVTQDLVGNYDGESDGKDS